MENLLENNWVVGIICSLIATVIASAVTALINVIRHKRRIYDANSYVLDKLRAYIVNVEIPPDNIFSALKRSAARRFSVKVEELLSNNDFLEEVVSEIAGNVYLKTDEQKNYIMNISNHLTTEEDAEEFDKNIAFFTRLSNVCIFITAFALLLLLGYLLFKYRDLFEFPIENLICAVAGSVLILFAAYIVNGFVFKRKSKH